VSGSPLSEIAVGKLTGAFKEFFVSDNMQVDVLYIVSLVNVTHCPCQWYGGVKFTMPVWRWVQHH